MILTKTNGAAACVLWGSIQPLVAHAFHPSDIVSNPFILFSFEGSWSFHWALPRHTIRSVTSLISSTSISSSAGASSRPFPWERWADPWMQTHQGIDLSCRLIINKSPTQPVLLLRPHIEKAVGMYEAMLMSWPTCAATCVVRACQDYSWMTDKLFDRAPDKISIIPRQVSSQSQLQKVSRLETLRMTFPTFMNEMLSFTTLQSVKTTGKRHNLCKIITRFFRYFWYKAV